MRQGRDQPVSEIAFFRIVQCANFAAGKIRFGKKERYSCHPQTYRGGVDSEASIGKAQGSNARHNAHRIDDFYDGRKLLLRVARIDALDHAWSGGDPALKFNAKAGPDATRMMLEFFARHRRG